MYFLSFCTVTLIIMEKSLQLWARKIVKSLFFFMEQRAILVTIFFIFASEVNIQYIQHYKSDIL